MGVECVKTCVVHASEMMASYDKDRVIVLLRERIDFERLSAIQFCPRGLIRITFKNASDKEDFARMGSLVLDGHDLSVTSSDKPPSLVYVHYFPAEGDDALIRDELSKYGEVIGIKHQNFSGIPGLLTGSRILTMLLSDPVPAEFRIDDYPVRVWYRGIPPFCQICRVNGHKAADCQFNGKCRKCGSPDHKAHACTRPWGQSVVPMEVAVPVVVPDPPETVVPAVSDSSVLDEGADEPVEDVVDEAPDVENVAVVEENVDVVEEVEWLRMWKLVPLRGLPFFAPRGVSLLLRVWRLLRVLRRSLAPLGPLRLSVLALFFRLLLLVVLSPLSFVGSFLWGIVLRYAGIPEMRPLFFHIRTVSCVGSPLLTIRIVSA